MHITFLHMSFFHPDKIAIWFCACLAHLKELSGTAPWLWSQEPCFRETGVSRRVNPAEVCSQLVRWPNHDRVFFGFFFFFETVSPYVARLSWHLLCSSGLASPSGSTCCHLLSAEITDVHHHARNPSRFFYSMPRPGRCGVLEENRTSTTCQLKMFLTCTCDRCHPWRPLKKT